MDASTDIPAWKRVLATPETAIAAGDIDRTRGQLGLLFQLRTLKRVGSQWTAPKGEPATAVRRGSEQRLGVRPAILGKNGTWITSDVGWGSLTHRIERLSLDPRQVTWFAQFAALHRTSVDGYRATETDWLHLDDFTSPLLWPHLESAAALGIPFLTGKRNQNVELSHSAQVNVAIGHDRGSRALRLEPEARIDGFTVIPTGTINDHGFYVCHFSGGLHVDLAPAPAEAVEALRWDRAGLRVPASDVEEFWKEIYPALTLRVPLRGQGLALPEVTTETVLVVTFLPRNVITTRWESAVGSHRSPLSHEPPADVPARIEDADAAAFVVETIPELEKAGIRVETMGEQPDYRALTEAPRIRFVAVPEHGNDWFGFGFVIVVGDYTVSYANVFAALSRGRKRLLMVDKTYLSLNHPVFDALRELIEDGAALREWETGAIVSRYHAPLFEPFQDESDQTPEAIAWRAAASAYVREPEPVEVPATLRATLRPYQLEGFRRLAHLRRHELGGILADDMGLGKTVQTIAMLLDAHEEKPGSQSLVVAPTSVVGTWASELARFAPTLRVATVTSTKDDIPHDADIVLTSYALFRLEFERWSETSWDTLVLDEAQYVKNHTSQVHECAEALPARVKFALTGTPLENGLLDLWSILHIVAPGLYPSRIRFTDRYVKAHSAERIAELRRRIRPLMLRRTKDQVEQDLPPKQEQVITIDLEPAHRALYDRYLQRERQKLLDLVEDLDRNRFIVFRSITLLRLLALDPRLIDEKEASGLSSSRLDELIDRVTDLAAEGHRALVFSQFTSFLSLVRERLDMRGIAYEYLDGATTKRDAVIRDFREGSAPLFLISLRAGGVGLTLTEADYVFLLDPWWNPAAEAQAIDRTHRIGQSKPVMVYRFVARDTVEEKVLALSERKRALFDEVLDEGSPFARELTADDVRELLA